MGKKIAIVTGGSSGIGFAIAKKFTEQNIHTIIVGRDQQKLNEVTALLGSNSEGISFDVTNLSGLPELVNSIVKKHGQVDILVNNAGINMKKSALEVTDQEFQNILLTNLTSVFAITREVAKNMIANKSGSIINISSMAAQYGLPGVVAYAASKTAIEGITRTLAVELSPHGVRVNCIAPGFIATKMSATALNGDPERRQKVLSRTPMGRLGDPQDVANAAYFLASDDSTFITGTVVPVDGGNSIGF
ncbi:MAG: SDR family oxidoreductase [Cyclobacteriaceae bacterium]|nr:SDR family oxidoreductase [Cyclobacteriaceae bacterium]UYN85770.1 MAG: SDR family oxidoreductase [Cyclobacteriaceae bacterium]